MNSIKIGLCFLDGRGKPVVIRPLKSNWDINLVGDKRITDHKYREAIINEVADILSDQLKYEIEPSLLQGMLKEIGDKAFEIEDEKEYIKENK